MTLWLFIGRLNPPHIWHIQTIEKALDENDEVIILLWSPINKDENNPLDFNKRKKLLEKVFNNIEKLKIIELLDNPSDLIWIYNIYKILYENSNWLENINFYGWDFENDSAYLVLNKYEDKLLNHKDYNMDP